MQHMRFSTGGCVIHKIHPHGYAGRVSAWFDASGRMLDAEYFDCRNRSRTVRVGTPLWEATYAAVRHLL